MFRTAVHENPNLSDIDRFNYLRSYREGPPYAAINGFPLTGTNYHNAIELLQEQFGNRQIIISSHVEKLLQLTPVVSSADIKKVRILYDLIEVHCRGLNGLGVTAESFGSILVPVLLSTTEKALIGQQLKRRSYLQCNWLYNYSIFVTIYICHVR